MTPTAHEQPAHRDLLLRAYAAYNARDGDALVALVSDDVDWPDNDVRLHGRRQVRAYWQEQWTCADTHDEPWRLVELDDGRTAVLVSQVVRSLDGSVISRGRFVHTYRIMAGRIKRLDIDPLMT